MAALFSGPGYGGSRKFYTWCTLSVIREVTTSIFSWSSVNYRVGQKVTKFGTFWDPARKLSALKPELWSTNPWYPRATKFLKMICVNRLGHVLFPFARCQHDHARTPYNTINSNRHVAPIKVKFVTGEQTATNFTFIGAKMYEYVCTRL